MARVEKAKQVATGKTLADITQDRQTLDEFVTEHEGELTPELLELFGDHEMERNAKIERVGYIITDEEGQIEVMDAQIARLKARKAAAEKRIEWLKNGYLASNLLAMGMEPGDKVKGALATVRLQLNNPRVDGAPDNARIDADEAEQQKLAQWYREGVAFTAIKHVYVLDRKAVLAALQNDTGLGAVQRAEWAERGVRVVRDISVRVA